MDSSVVDFLKQTPKGRLQYNTNATSSTVVSSADSSFNTGLNDSFPTPIPGSTCFYSSPCRTDAAPSPTSSTYNVRADRSPAAYPGSRHPLSAASPAVDGSKLWKTPADEPDCVKNHSTHTSQTPLAMGGHDDSEERPTHTTSVELLQFQTDLQQLKNQEELSKKRSQQDMEARIDVCHQQSQAKFRQTYREQQEKALANEDQVLLELQSMEREMEIELQQAEAEFARKEQDRKAVDERQHLQAEELHRRQLEAQKLAEEQERLKKEVAEVAAKMASRYKTTAQKLLGYADQQHLPQPAAQQLLEKIGRVVTMCLKLARAPYVGAEAELKKLPSVDEVDREVMLMIAAASKNAEEKQKRAADVANLAKPDVQSTKAASPSAPQQTAANKTSQSPVATSGEASSASATKTSVPEIWRDALTPSTCERYSKLSETLSTTEDALAKFREDASLKAYRDLLGRVVITAVNTVSSQSAQHMKDKIKRMLDILGCKNVKVGIKSVSAADHPDAKLYCTYMLARHIVMQGEKQIASHAESAFSFAAVIIGVWNEDPLFGELLLGHLYRSCPVAVPFYPPRLEGQSDNDYRKSLGFRFKENTPETNDQFYTRITGYMRLYGAIMQASPPPGVDQNPHGIGHCWVWLARILNLEPRPTVTATAISAVFEMAGHAMKDAYGQQFVHVLKLMGSRFLSKVESITPKDMQGPLARLRLTLENGISQGGRFSIPEGHIAPSYWTTVDYNEPTVEQLITGTAFASHHY